MLFVGSIQNVRSSSRCAISACSKTMLTILIAQGFDEITQILSKANFEKNRKSFVIYNFRHIQRKISIRIDTQ